MGGGCHGIKKNFCQAQGCLRGVNALLYAGFRSRLVHTRKNNALTPTERARACNIDNAVIGSVGGAESRLARVTCVVCMLAAG